MYVLYTTCPPGVGMSFILRGVGFLPLASGLAPNAAGEELRFLLSGRQSHPASRDVTTSTFLLVAVLRGLFRALIP